MTTTTRPSKADPACVDAVETARTALRAELSRDPAGATGGDPDLESGAGERFGEHLGHVAEADRVVTHYFAVTSAGYQGWRWAVTLARAPRQKMVTVSEIVMLPGDDAVLAPQWVPWSARLSREDWSPGDLLPVAADDVRLAPGYLVGDEDLDRATREVVVEVGLGREWVLSADGREQAADRWYADVHGPDTPIARSAPAPCGTCGFLIRLSGPISQMFGACANASSPSDGSVVSFDHGCGGHSSVRLEHEAVTPVQPEPYLDTLSWDDVEPFARP